MDQQSDVNDAAQAELTALWCRFAERFSPTPHWSRRYLDEFWRRYRAARRGPDSHQAGVTAASSYLLSIEHEAGTPSQRDSCRELAKRYFDKESYGADLCAIGEVVRNREKELAYFPGMTDRRAALSKLAWHAKFVVPGLRRLDQAKLASAMSPLLRSTGELPVGEVVTGATVVITAVRPEDSYLFAGARMRKFDVLGVFRDTIQGLKVTVDEELRAPAHNLGRPRDLRSVARHLEGLADAMEGLDPRTLSNHMPLQVGGEQPATLTTVYDMLVILAGVARRSATIPSSDAGRPEVPEPLMLGVAKVIEVWERATGESPKFSLKRGSIADLSCDVLRPINPTYTASQVRTALRYALRPRVGDAVGAPV